MNSYPQKPVVARPKNVTQGGCYYNRLLGVLLLLLCAVGLSIKAAAANFTANNDGKDIAITAESCLPANGYIDPGETNTVSFVVKNTSGAERKEVKVSIIENSNIILTSGETTVGTVAKDATFTVSFSFRAVGSCGGTLVPTLLVKSDANTGGEVVGHAAWSFQLGATVKTPYSSSNTSPIAVNDFNTDSAKLGRATPYPSSITVAGVPKAETGETVDRVTVTLNNVTHSWSQDLQALLVGPNGKSVVLMANAGGASDITAAINNVTLTFDESASATLPPAGQIVSGSYKSSNFGAGSFPDVGSANSGSLDVFNNMSDPNGSWKLYVIDDSTQNQGLIAGGWSLTIRTTKIVCCGAGQLWPSITRIPENTQTEDLNGGENVQIASFYTYDLDDSDVSKLNVTAVSADQSKVTNDNLVIEGSGNVKVVKVKKLVANAFGTDLITVVVTDPQGHTSTSSFNLKITPVNDVPTMSQVLGQKLPHGTPTGPLAFTVGDVETLPENLIVIPESSDQNIVPDANIVTGGSGANRTVNVIPKDQGASGTSGAATITLRIRDAGDGTNPPVDKVSTFVVNFGAQTGYPTITPLGPVAVDEDKSIVIPFQVRSGLDSVSPDALTITKSSGNSALLPLNNMVLGGSGIDRTLTLTPAANQNGQVSVTLTVANGSLTDSTTFTLTVNNVNDAPTITSVAPQTTNEDTTSGDIVFTVGDVETSAAALDVNVSSDNTGLIPNIKNPTDLAALGGYSVAVNGSARTIRVRPAPNQYGKATLTVSVLDSGDPIGTPSSDPTEVKRPKSTTTTFVLTVNAVNDAPKITSVGNDTSNLVSWVGDTDPTISFPEDSGSTADDTKAQRTIVLAGINGGQPNESSQTVSVTAASNKPDVVSIVKIDPASVTGSSANTTLTVKLGENKYTPSDSLVEITLVLTDNGGTDLGGVASATKKFKINVTPVNDAPSLSFPTLPAPLPGQTISELNVPKNRSFTLPMSLSDVETPKTLIDVQTSVSGDTAGKYPNGSILVDLARTVVTFLPDPNVPVTPPYTVTVTVNATDLGGTNSDTATDKTTTTKTFKVTIRDIEPPTIVASATDFQIDEDNVASATLSVSDNHAVTSSNPTFAIKSDNPIVVPNDGVLLGPLTAGSDQFHGSRALAIVPAADQFGVANVTITAKDDETLESSVTIKVTVRAVSDRPTITLRGIIAPTVDANGIPQIRTATILEDKKLEVDESTDSDKVEFVVSDAANETPANNLVITKASSNTELVPLDNIVWTTTGNVRNLVVTPAANKNGTSKITLTVTDESGLSSTAEFNLAVTAVNDAPSVNQVSNLTLNENAGEQTVNLSGIGVGPDSNQSVISVVASEKDKGSDPATHNVLQITQQPGLPDSNGNTSFKFRPRDFASGTGTITVTVTDNGDTSNEGKNSKDMSFDVSVQSVNHLPVISFQQGTVDTDIDIVIPPGGVSSVIPVYVSDTGETPSERLVLTATSSNPALIPNTSTNIQFGGGFGSRSVILIPASGQGGSSIVTLTVTDANGGSNSATINVTVQPGENPSITLTPSTQKIQVNQFTDLIQINLFDAQTPPEQLIMGYQEGGLVTSDNPTLVPASPSNIQFGGAGANRVMIILPNQNQTGTAHITLTVKDTSGRTGTAVFTLQVLGSPPTISSPTPAQVNVDAGKTSPPVTVTVGDKETFPALLAVTGKSSDQAIVADNNIFALGGATRSVTVLAGNKGGSATITLTVADSEGQTATTSFVVNVNDSNKAPTITSIPPQTTTVNKPTSLINFVVGDAETAAAALTVTATSGNTTLVPNSSANIVILTSAGNPANRSLLITPANNQTGTALMTVTVKDGGGKETSTTFPLTVSRFVVQNDFNGDGSQDIVFEDNGGFLAAWFMSGDDQKSASFFTPNNVGDIGWKVAGAGDFDGDSKTDLLFQYKDGTLAIWALDGVTRKSAKFLSPAQPGSSAWKAVATGDFNNDGKVDILFQHTDGTMAIWYMDGTTLSSVGMLKPSNAGAGWTVVGTGDVNRDGNLDIIFQYTDSSLAVWYLTGGHNQLLAGWINPQMPGSGDWRAVGTMDLNGDGAVDILFQNRADSSLAIWYMNKEKLVLGKLLNPSNAGGTWKAVAP